MCKYETWVSIGENELGIWETCTSCQTTRLVPNKNTAELLEGCEEEEKIVRQKLKLAEENTDK